MELMALRTFQTVVEEGGILAASRKLNTVQSNVTIRIRKLEEELGTDLFRRTGRGLELAPSGRVLLEYARRMLHMEREMAAALRERGDTVAELRIGSMETFAALYLPSALKALRNRYPGIELRVQANTTGALVESVLNHKLDCAFVAGPVVHPELVFRELVVEELVLVCAAACDPVQLPLILFREGCAYRTRALAFQKTLGHAVSDAMEFGTLEGILGCVSVGLGWTLMPRRTVAQSSHAADLMVHNVPEEIGRVPTGMVHLKDSHVLNALDALSESLISCLD